MTVLLHDATEQLQRTSPGSCSGLQVDELVYADDTLLVGIEQPHVAAYMEAIRAAGQNYGLAFNWRKLEVMPIRCEALFHQPDGTQIGEKDSLVYLGSLLDKAGNIGSELNRRLGAAQADFKQLSKIWRHTCLSLQKKLEIFESCVVSKLLYCLHTAWLNVADLRKIDAFHAQALRSISNTPHSYVSRVSNKIVLEKCGQPKLSSKLHYRQLTLMHKIARLPDEDVTRQILFKPSSFELLTPASPRKRGRPRNCWTNQVYNLAIQAAGNRHVLQELWHSPPHVWQRHVWNFCCQMP